MDPVLLPEGYFVKWAIMVASMAFIYVSLGRATLLRHEKPARAIMSLAISFTAISAIGDHWQTLSSIAGYAVVAGLSSLLVWRVALQRGKTPHELKERKEEQERKWSRDLEKWRQDHK